MIIYITFDILYMIINIHAIYFILLANAGYNDHCNFSNYVIYYHIVFTLLGSINVWT